MHAHPATHPSIHVLYINNSTPGRTQPHYRDTLGSHVTCKKSPQQVTYVHIKYILLHQTTLSMHTPPAPPDPVRAPLQLHLTPYLLPPFHLTLSIGPLCPADPLKRAHLCVHRKPVHVLITAACVLGIATRGIGAASGWH